MKPSSYPHEVFTEDNASAPDNHEEQPEDIAQPWQLAGNCPENTIPIKRITKEDLLRVDYIKTYGEKTCCSNISQPHQFYHRLISKMITAMRYIYAHHIFLICHK